MLIAAGRCDDCLFARACVQMQFFCGWNFAAVSRAGWAFLTAVAARTSAKVNDEPCDAVSPYTLERMRVFGSCLPLHRLQDKIALWNARAREMTASCHSSPRRSRRPMPVIQTRSSRGTAGGKPRGRSTAARLDAIAATACSWSPATTVGISTPLVRARPVVWIYN